MQTLLFLLSQRRTRIKKTSFLLVLIPHNSLERVPEQDYDRFLFSSYGSIFFFFLTNSVFFFTCSFSFSFSYFSIPICYSCTRSENGGTRHNASRNFFSGNGLFYNEFLCRKRKKFTEKHYRTS